MASSVLTLATRALVSIILSLARAYEVSVAVNRDSDPTAIFKGCRRILLQAHPDKGGQKKDMQRLQEAKETWEKARGQKTGRPPSADKPPKSGKVAMQKWRGQRRAERRKAGFRTQGVAVLLT